MDEKPSPRRPSIKQLSKTPSWVMLGFILGVLFIRALPHSEPPAPRPIVLAPVEKKEPSSRSRLTTVEAVFAQWSQYASWSDDVTQVALWSPEVGDFAEAYEVRRIDGVFYFRSLPHLTNRVIRHGKQPPSECPLQFTETAEQYRDWRENGRFERPAEVPRPVLVQPRADAPAAEPTPSVGNQQVELPPAPTLEKGNVSLPNR